MNPVRARVAESGQRVTDSRDTGSGMPQTPAMRWVRGRRRVGPVAVLALVAALVPAATTAAGADPGTGDGELVVTGRLETVVVDDFARHRTRTETTLLLRDGTRLDVRRTPGLPTAGRVTATVDAPGSGRLSTRSAEGLALARTLDGPVTLRDVRPGPARAAATGVPHRVHVAVVRNHGDWGGVTEATLRSRVQAVLDGWEVEGGASLPTFDIAGWKDFSPDSGCGLGASFSPVVGEAAAELYPDEDFLLEPDHLVVLVPDECETDAVGTASVGQSLGSGGVSVSSLEQPYGEPTLAHELGHNFSLDHSGAETCDFSDLCWENPYADIYDVMGGATNGTVPALNSPHRDDLGLLAAAEVSALELAPDQATASRTVTLRPRSEGTGLRTLRVVEPETLVPWYVDYRSGTARDATAGYRAFPDYPPGVTVMAGEGRGSYLWSEPGYLSPKSWAIGTTFTNPAGTISVRVDAIDPGVSATVTVTVRSDAPPLVVPDTALVTGTPRVDDYLEFDRTGWPTDASLLPEWWVDGEWADFGDRLWVSPDYHGKTVQLVVSATRPGFRGVVRRSASIGPVTNPVTGSVQIQAQPLAIGSPVTSTVTTLPVDARRDYQWYRDDAAIGGATASSYVPTTADVGGTLTLEVTASRTGRDTSVLVSNALGPVPAGLQPGVPTVTGRPAVGKRLTADPGTWPAGTTLGYQWLRDGAPIAGATSAAYQAGAGDLGRDVAVRVRGVRGGQNATATSPAVTIGPGTLRAATPKVSGKPKVGKTLTAKPGRWTPRTRLRYRWLADGRKIRGATSATLRLTGKHRGKRISVRVTGTKPGYTTATRTSASTRPVRR